MLAFQSGELAQRGEHVGSVRLSAFELHSGKDPEMLGTLRPRGARQSCIEVTTAGGQIATQKSGMRGKYNRDR